MHGRPLPGDFPPAHLAPVSGPAVISLAGRPDEADTPPQPPLVLLVEDHPLDTELALMAFAANGLEGHLKVVEDGQEALEYLTRQRSEQLQPPRLVLLDLNMRRMNGFDFLRAVQGDEEFQRVPVIVFTTSTSASDRERCLALGATDYMVKPDQLEDFIQLIDRLARRWLGGR